MISSWRLKVSKWKQKVLWLIRIVHIVALKKTNSEPFIRNEFNFAKYRVVHWWNREIFLCRRKQHNINLLIATTTQFSHNLPKIFFLVPNLHEMSVFIEKMASNTRSNYSNYTWIFETFICINRFCIEYSIKEYAKLCMDIFILSIFSEIWNFAFLDIL